MKNMIMCMIFDLFVKCFFWIIITIQLSLLIGRIMYDDAGYIVTILYTVFALGVLLRKEANYWISVEDNKRIVLSITMCIILVAVQVYVLYCSIPDASVLKSAMNKLKFSNPANVFVIPVPMIDCILDGELKEFVYQSVMLLVAPCVSCMFDFYLVLSRVWEKIKNVSE